MNDKFDISQLQIPPEELERYYKAQREKQPKLVIAAKPGAFAILPYERMMTEAGRQGNAALAVLIELAFLGYRKGQTVDLPNTKFRAVGISHDAKVRALRQLEAGGLITVDWRAPPVGGEEGEEGLNRRSGA
jgi:hypothetical protein